MSLAELPNLAGVKEPADDLIAGLRQAGIRDERVLAAMRAIPRDQFVPETFAEHAWSDIALPIGLGQTISQPFVVAAMTQALAVMDRHQVLEIGTGSGYQTAILARLARRVFTIERHYALWRSAGQRFAGLRLRNITSRFGDGTKGWVEPAPCDRILVTAAAAVLPPALLDLLAPGGILIAPLGPEFREQKLMRIQRKAEGGFETTELGLVRFVPLVPGLPRTHAAGVL